MPVKQTLDMLSIPRSTFYRWYDLYVDGGFDALADSSPRPRSVWNRIPDVRRDDLIEFALEQEARHGVFDYIEMFYNPTRKHTNNGMPSPVDYEIKQQRMNSAGV